MKKKSFSDISWQYSLVQNSHSENRRAFQELQDELKDVRGSIGELTAAVARLTEQITTRDEVRENTAAAQRRRRREIFDVLHYSNILDADTEGALLALLLMILNAINEGEPRPISYERVRRLLSALEERQ